MIKTEVYNLNGRTFYYNLVELEKRVKFHLYCLFNHQIRDLLFPSFSLHVIQLENGTPQREYYSVTLSHILHVVLNDPIWLIDVEVECNPRNTEELSWLCYNLFVWIEENRRTRRKTLGSRMRTNNKIQHSYDAGSRTRTRATGGRPGLSQLRHPCHH